MRKGQQVMQKRIWTMHQWQQLAKRKNPPRRLKARGSMCSAACYLRCPGRMLRLQLGPTPSYPAAHLPQPPTRKQSSVRRPALLRNRASLSSVWEAGSRVHRAHPQFILRKPARLQKPAAFRSFGWGPNTPHPVASLRWSSHWWSPCLRRCVRSTLHRTPSVRRVLASTQLLRGHGLQRRTLALLCCLLLLWLSSSSIQSVVQNTTRLDEDRWRGCHQGDQVFSCPPHLRPTRPPGSLATLHPRQKN